MSNSKTEAESQVPDVEPLAIASWSDVSALWTDNASSSPSDGVVSVVATMQNVVVPPVMNWYGCQLVPGQVYRLRALVEGTWDKVDRAARVVFEGVQRGLGLSESGAGAHIRLHTGPGVNRTDRLFMVDSATSRIGLRTVEEPNTAVLRTFVIERVEQRPAIDYFFSFDVEAGVKRARTNPIDELVWGNIEGGEYGLRRLCSILDEHGLTGNFLIDFGSCAREGEKQLRRIADYLGESGHEIHMHLHTDKLADRWGLPNGASFKFESSTYEMVRRMLDFTVRSFEKHVGGAPRVFRSGSYKMSSALVLAAGTLGIEALSNVRDNVADPLIGGDRVAGREPFRWENGVVEIPVDVSSPERLSLEQYLRKQSNAVMRKRFRRTCNIVMHSWSLIRQNQQGVHDAFAPEYEERFRQICQLATTTGRTWGYGEYLDRYQASLPPVVRLSHILPAETGPRETVSVSGLATCNVCDTTFSFSTVRMNECPSCGSRPQDRQLRYVLDTHGRIFDGRQVVAHGAVHLQLLRLVEGATHVLDFTRELAEGGLGDGSADCLVGLYIDQSTHRAPDAIATAARIIRPGGLLVSTAPHAGGSAESPEAPALPLATYLDLLSRDFEVTSVPGFDPVTGSAAQVFLAYRK